MINHMRTLLLNQTRDQLACEWDEYVPADFAPQALPESLRQAWVVLFGTDPDRYQLNWRANQYLQLIHATEYRTYMRLFDPRITYQVPRRLDDGTLPRALVQPQTHLDVLGVPTDDPARGRLARSFRIRQTGSASLELTEPAYPRIQNVSNTGAPIPLWDSGLSVLITGAALGEVWNIHTLALPSGSLSRVRTGLQALAPALLQDLFRGGRHEPYQSFYALWADSRGVALQLAGFLLAWMCRAEEANRGR